jgi:hypothetical protein
MARRIEIDKTPKAVGIYGAAFHDHLKVTGYKDGPVTALDKFKGYYKEAIAVVGTVVIILNQLTPVIHTIANDVVQHWFTVAVAFVTGLGVLLTKNEQWVDDL